MFSIPGSFSFSLTFVEIHLLFMNCLLENPCFTLLFIYFTEFKKNNSHGYNISVALPVCKVKEKYKESIYMYHLEGWTLNMCSRSELMWETAACIITARSYLDPPGVPAGKDVTE